MTDTYGVDIAQGEDDALILASVLALDLAQAVEALDQLVVIQPFARIDEEVM